mmetsp:Transcript_16557/g.29161  ORF Transcript_16557/g.29161 Transcript_16557/m.29161 type:complete len:210 (-) Transcript_16557:324-953(-)
MQRRQPILILVQRQSQRFGQLPKRTLARLDQLRINHRNAALAPLRSRARHRRLRHARHPRRHPIRHIMMRIHHHARVPAHHSHIRIHRVGHEPPLRMMGMMPRGSVPHAHVPRSPQRTPMHRRMVRQRRVAHGGMMVPHAVGGGAEGAGAGDVAHGVHGVVGEHSGGGGVFGHGGGHGGGAHCGGHGGGVHGGGHDGGGCGGGWVAGGG